MNFDYKFIYMKYFFCFTLHFVLIINILPNFIKYLILIYVLIKFKFCLYFIVYDFFHIRVQKT